MTKDMGVTALTVVVALECQTRTHHLIGNYGFAAQLNSIAPETKSLFSLIQIGTFVMSASDETTVPSPLVLVSNKRAINQANGLMTGTADMSTFTCLRTYAPALDLNGLGWRLQLFVHHANGLRIEIKSLNGFSNLLHPMISMIDRLE